MNDVCSIELLTDAVANRLSADEEAALHEHLERCDACCARMEQLVGGEQWQKEAASLLIKDDLDTAVPEASHWSEVDFSVEHLEPSDDANVLGQLGGYDVLEIIGRGGMGVVLKAHDRELKRLVAIKTLSPHLAHSSVARKRFAREAQAAAAVVNPHVIAIHHVQPTGRLPFLIMPLLAGETLAQRLKSRAPLELTEVLRIGTQIALGLAAAHDQGIVHRDVKPANIFLEKGVERVVITDFGLARAADDVSMTRLGVVAGTPEYMSPEQARGEALDARSDLFSLGCVLYEMATGVSPFRSDSTIATLRQIVDDKPVAIASLAPELPPWFSHIVERLLSKDPDQRFVSANEVSQLLEQCLSHLQQPTSVPLPASLVSHAKGRRSFFNSTRKGILTMLGAFGMALLGMVLWQATDPPNISSNRTSDDNENKNGQKSSNEKTSAETNPFRKLFESIAASPPDPSPLPVKLFKDCFSSKSNDGTTVGPDGKVSFLLKSIEQIRRSELPDGKIVYEFTVDPLNFFQEIALLATGEKSVAEEILDGMLHDPLGPRIDVRQMLRNQLANRVKLTCQFHSDREFDYMVEIELMNEAAFVPNFQRFFESEPYFLANATKDLYVVNPSSEQTNQGGGIFGATVRNHRLYWGSLKMVEPVRNGSRNLK